uniref:Uncharacterized protein MANES_13G011000 n=2 Tax=Rhizophora mucronata TaxID=61149 RepID=A0A2P2KV54_RHIMU
MSSLTDGVEFKTAIRWDWESLVTFNATNAESPKKLPAADWEIDSGSFYSCEGVSGNGGSGSDLGLASLSKSLKPASISSSYAGEVKAPKFTLEASEAMPDNFSNEKKVLKKRPTVTSSTLGASVGPVEPLLSLKLGKRTYFEDVCAGTNAKTSSLSTAPGSSVTPAKRSKSCCQGTPASRCQVEGCDTDLSSAKEYHRKHRVCESHSKFPKVIVAGVECRFCQQCSRFHGLSEFDEKKRSCRRRLSDHNARRRKPQPGSIQLEPARLSAMLYDRRQQVNFDWNAAQILHARPNEVLTLEGSSACKFMVTKEYMSKPAKMGGMAGKLYSPGQELTNSSLIDRRDSNSFIPSKNKGIASEIPSQGLGESALSFNADSNQNLSRALSLLSTKLWASCDPKLPLDQPFPTTHASMPLSSQHATPQGLPVASSDYWGTKQWSTDSREHASNTDIGNFSQDLQPLRAPYQGDFYSNRLK